MVAMLLPIPVIIVDTYPEDAFPGPEWLRKATAILLPALVQARRACTLNHSPTIQFTHARTHALSRSSSLYRSLAFLTQQNAMDATD